MKIFCCKSQKNKFAIRRDLVVRCPSKSFFNDKYILAAQNLNRVRAQRRFNVYTTSILFGRRRTNAKMTLCEYWEMIKMYEESTYCLRCQKFQC